jgi:type I restriction-modification system DNA methylase subunit
VPAPKEIIELVERFERNFESYKSGKYNETQLRREFIDPFFKALGWDVDNSQGYAEAYKDVIHEDSIKISGLTKAPDYCFRIGGTRKFFLEAKKPAINIKEDINPAFQLRRYAWSAKLPLSILTDFEEFAIYDCRIKPNNTDKASKARIMYCTYKEYINKWDEIEAIFSRVSILKGSFDKYAQDTKNKRGTAEVDIEFLKEIETWRTSLAKNIARKNSQLTQRELNYAVQLTIDRIIFLRICEDRRIETYGRLKEATKSKFAYKNLMELFYQADTKYNSGLFHFKNEKNQSNSPDDITPNLKIDDQVIKDITKNLYYPDSPYAFSILPADILGQVYEMFLGKIIKLDNNHNVIIEEKPEVKKAGGVFYTPTYIVDYIIKNTVGKLLEGKSIQQAKKIKIIDPACGSGSFLIAAYQYLLDWYKNEYVKEIKEIKDIKLKASKYKNELYQVSTDNWKLTTTERKKILLNNIYGVDIDTQAVEVTKLSLLLKVLEDEYQLKLINERALPDLGNNIKCGNSLVNSDFFSNSSTKKEINQEEMYRINAFDWKVEFSEITKSGGFDAVIGNPPYIRTQIMRQNAPYEKNFYKKHYKSACKGNYDIYVVFVEKGLELLNKSGYLGYILPHKFFNTEYGEPLRELISKNKNVNSIVHFGDQQVFKGATTYTCLLFLNKKSLKEFTFHKVDDLIEWKNENISLSEVIPAKELSNKEWNIIIGDNADLFRKMTKIPTKLANVSDKIFQGVVTGKDPVYILSKATNNSYFSEATGKEHKLEEELMHPLCKGSLDIRKYRVEEITKFVLFPYKQVKGKTILLSQEELSSNYPNIWNYLLENRSILESRENGKWKHDKWYAFGRSQNLSCMEIPKILTPSIANSASYTLDLSGKYYFVGSGGGGGGGYGITIKKNVKLSYQYLLGLLNSELLDSYLKFISSRFSGGYYAYNKQYIKKLPIKIISFSDRLEKEKHDEISTLVSKILELHNQMENVRTDQERNIIKRQIEATDKNINRLVYELYGFSSQNP